MQGAEECRLRRIYNTPQGEATEGNAANDILMVDQGAIFVIGEEMSQQGIGSVMVVGGGIAGMQAALDLADTGYYVYLVERSTSIGGIMSQLDKTFPTNDCAM